MNKYIDFYAEQNKDKYPTKEEATAILPSVRKNLALSMDWNV